MEYQDDIKEKDELNYKQAYYFLFNHMTEVIAYIKFLQTKAEAVCVNEISPEQIKIDITAILYGLVNNITDLLTDNE